MFLCQRNLIKSFRMNWRSLCTVVEYNNGVPKPVLKTEIEKENEADAILEKIFDEASVEKSEGEAEAGAGGTIDWSKSMNLIKRTEEVLPELRVTADDLSTVRAAKPTLNLASLVNESQTLQRLVDLGVGLWFWESRGFLELAVKLNFEEDVAPLIRFLTDLGVSADLLGHVLTKNPALLEESIEDLTTRVNYLISKKFTEDDIVDIVCNSWWLTISVKGIDGRLGFLQKTFNLRGNEVRQVAVQNPELVLKKDLVLHVNNLNFSLIEEMGFSKREIKKMLLVNPMLFSMREVKMVLRNFDIIHNQIGIKHSLLRKFPTCLLVNDLKIKQRHLFLKEIGKDQYDPLLPNYASLDMLVEGTDQQFCDTVAKCELNLYYKFLKTL